SPNVLGLCPVFSTAFTASAITFESTSHTAAQFVSNRPGCLPTIVNPSMFCIPRFLQPINPRFTRSLAPNTRAGTNIGAAKSVEAAAVVCRKRRRDKDVQLALDMAGGPLWDKRAGWGETLSYRRRGGVATVVR